MKSHLEFYIDGQWIAARTDATLDVINPATEKVEGKIALGAQEDVNAAVAAARAAFNSYSRTPVNERIELLSRITTVYQNRMVDIADAITREMGAPAWLAQSYQAGLGIAHFETAKAFLGSFSFEEDLGNTHVFKEPVGVCGLITPWNWPMNQISCKLAPALATGCTVVWKPSEAAPLSAHILMEVLDEAGVPAGVVNMVNGDGPTVGAAISAHSDVDMVSFTGSTGAGIAVAEAAAKTVKRVAQELGGKSANIILDDADLEAAVVGGLQTLFVNSGQNCNAPSRMLVPADKLETVTTIAKTVAEQMPVGGGDAPEGSMGPLANAKQWDRVQTYIDSGMEEGATLVAGGPGKPDSVDTGYFVKPTVFSNVKNNMTIAREEIFGPVLSIIPYVDESDAIQIANDTTYGLSGYVSSTSPDRAQNVAKQLRTGMVHINGAGPDVTAPFGGYKQSGNGREWGAHAFDEFLELKSVMGYGA